ncbi:1-acyl-sn-glycerol-3-phosphate acyltransferase [Pseudanabaena sp. FACHB-1050]|jgi:1-acyl-sn-glycerol-3-phosphate acyltransferase|uniref:1-acyl-sn-glycerol-3-phosphate acyltransferase n=2 Tax=Phormidium tenue TaxID=126344 RepID=A0ABR8CG69_9CYAN|nr:1-acyl-sn-glycerol-3-phosphate acyltransferase [Phormidium tenue FACHB-1050]
MENYKSSETKRIVANNNATNIAKDKGGNPFFYKMFKWLVVRPLLYLFYQERIYGTENVPLTGNLIVVSNHASDFDPLIVGSCMGRPVAFMAKEELFEIPVLSQAIQAFGAYPVKRGAGDRAAIRAAIASIEKGWATGIFLQGTRTLDGRVTEPKLGAAMIAAKTQAPFLPISIWGTETILPKGAKFPKLFQPVTVRIGQLIPAPETSDRATLEAYTQKCADAINALHALGR